MSKRAELVQAITTLESQKALLGESAVATILATLRAQLDSLDQTTVEQRKQVTILVADISGFTAFSSEKDAEDTRENSLFSSYRCCSFYAPGAV